MGGCLEGAAGSCLGRGLESGWSLVIVKAEPAAGGEAKAAGFPFTFPVPLGKLILTLQRQNKTHKYLSGI